LFYLGEPTVDSNCEINRGYQGTNQIGRIATVAVSGSRKSTARNPGLFHLGEPTVDSNNESTEATAITTCRNPPATTAIIDAFHVG
jgi:hypothetical protein